jgi:hypothetical protein
MTGDLDAAYFALKSFTTLGNYQVSGPCVTTRAEPHVILLWDCRVSQHNFQSTKVPVSYLKRTITDRVCCK